MIKVDVERSGGMQKLLKKLSSDGIWLKVGALENKKHSVRLAPVIDPYSKNKAEKIKNNIQHDKYTPTRERKSSGSKKYASKNAGGKSFSSGGGQSQPTIATVAFWQEYGTDHIPARSFLRSTIKDNKNKWSKIFASEYQRLDGDIRKAFESVGEDAVIDIIEKIKSNIPPGLALETIKQKIKDRAFEPHLALVNTGELIDSFSYEIK